MGFGWQDALATAAGGPLGYGIYQAVKGNGSTTVDQVPLETPEEHQARQGLLGFANTGKFGNYSAGDPYAGSFGDFGMSALENSAQGQVTNRLGSKDFGIGDQTI